MLTITVIHKIEFTPGNPVETLLKKLLDSNHLLNKKIDVFMARTAEDFAAVMQRIDAATTAEAQRLKDLKDQIAQMGLDASQEETIFAQLDAAASRLEGLGADPENPVPETPTEG